jgi:hypothetical protein
MRQGYLVDELKFIPLDKYKESIVDPDIHDEIIKLRWERMEKKRKAKIAIVLKDRQSIIEELEKHKI